MSYDLFQHRHNFSAWAAARAVNPRFTTVRNLRDALENCGVVRFVKDPKSLEVDAKVFRELHRSWCVSVVDFLQDRHVRNVTFGRAAKLIAVYLKSMIILGSNPTSRLASVAYPPIDSILLRNLARSQSVDCKRGTRSRAPKWSMLSEAQYYDMVEHLRSFLNPEDPFWVIEQYWTVTDE